MDIKLPSNGDGDWDSIPLDVLESAAAEVDQRTERRNLAIAKLKASGLKPEDLGIKNNDLTNDSVKSVSVDTPTKSSQTKTGERFTGPPFPATEPVEDTPTKSSQTKTGKRFTGPHWDNPFPATEPVEYVAEICAYESNGFKGILLKTTGHPASYNPRSSTLRNDHKHYKAWSAFIGSDDIGVIVGKTVYKCKDREGSEVHPTFCYVVKHNDKSIIPWPNGKKDSAVLPFVARLVDENGYRIVHNPEEVIDVRRCKIKEEFGFAVWEEVIRKLRYSKTMEVVHVNRNSQGDFEERGLGYDYFIRHRQTKACLAKIDAVDRNIDNPFKYPWLCLPPRKHPNQQKPEQRPDWYFGSLNASKVQGVVRYETFWKNAFPPGGKWSSYHTNRLQEPEFAIRAIAGANGIEPDEEE